VRLLLLRLRLLLRRLRLLLRRLLLLLLLLLCGCREGEGAREARLAPGRVALF
jgi:hypothetical protein